MTAKIVDCFDSHKILVFFVPFFIYMLNGREISSGDPTPTVFTAVNLVKHGTIYLDDLHDYIAYHSLPYYLSRRKDHIVSNYPIFPGIMATPIFAPFIWIGMINPGDGDLVWKYLSKISGAAFTSLSVLFMYLVLKRLLDKSGALILSGAYGLGTALWPITSQSLWQHGPSVFWWSVCFYALLRAAEALDKASGGIGVTPALRKFLLLAGLAAGGAELCRTVNGIGVMVLSVTAVRFFRRDSLYFIAPALLLTGALLGYNMFIFGSWKGGDSVLHTLHWQLDHVSGGSWSTPLSVGLPGQLISPSRGLLIFSPFLIFGFWGMLSIGRRPGISWRLIAWTVPAPLLMLIVFAKYAVWWGGNAHYGARYQIETYPFFLLYIAAVWPSLTRRRWLRYLFIFLLLYSLAVQWIGAFCYPSEWASKPVALWEDKDRLWDWTYNEIWTCAKSGIKKPF